jgi:hypothetical protein
MPSLLAILGLDASTFQQKLNESQKLANHAGKEIAHSLSDPIKGALGAFAAGALIEGAFEMAERVHNLSKEFRQNAETVQRWDIAAKRAGMTAEDIGNAFNKIKKAREAAVGGNKLGGFGEFEIPMEALRDASISTEQVLERMVEVAGEANLTDSQDVAAMELMGKSGAKILSAFKELHELGPVKLLSDEEVQKMSDAMHGFEALKRTAAQTAGKGYIAATAAPASVWETAKHLWNYAMGKEEGAVFGANHDIPDNLRGSTSTTSPDKLHGAVSVGMSTEQHAEWKRLEAELAEKIFQNQLKTMTVEQKRAELQKELTKHLRAASDANADADWIKGTQETLKAEELRGELAGLKDTAHRSKSHPDTNALQKIGAFSMQSSDLAQNVRQLLKHVEHIAHKAPNKALAIGGF